MKSLALFVSASLAGFLITACSPTEEKETDKTSDSDLKKEKKVERSRMPIINIGELSKMSKEDLRLARNSIFAKYGRVFKSKDLREHFAGQSWYKERPSFRQSDMSKSDIALVKLIQRWEEKTEVLWKEDVDITGNGRYENCFVLYNKNKGTYSVVVNDFSEEFDHFWGQDKEENPPADWIKINVAVVDINSNDARREIVISQRYNDWEDPGTHNVVVAFKKGVQVTELGSTDYDSGELRINDNGTVTMRVSNCPEHDREYKLEKGKLVATEDFISPMPPEGCAACFSGESLIAVSSTESKRIDELRRGDQVLTFDRRKGKFYPTKVQRILQVYHENLYTVSFEGQTISVTGDHPFLTNKGWCSIQPDKTEKRYGYENVSLLSEGSQLIGINMSPIEIESISRSTKSEMTYTIENLESGSNFIINGVVVGVEPRVSSVK